MSDADQTPPEIPPDGDTPESELALSGGIVRAAIVFEGMIVLGAYVLGEIVERPPFEYIRWNSLDALWGTLAALPLLAVLLVAMRLRLAAVDRVREFCRDFLAPMFREATWLQLVVVCALAGLGEEMLFRGLIQRGLRDALGEPYGVWAGLAIASVTFGLAHSVTRGYAIAAGLVGLYFGGLLILTDNLLVPIVAHAAYDLGAFVYLFRMERLDSAVPTVSNSAAASNSNGDDAEAAQAHDTRDAAP
ncbi:MAG: CPBP family intramembrane glutamic endopeptidase [Pirellulales bacterium]